MSEREKEAGTEDSAVKKFLNTDTMRKIIVIAGIAGIALIMLSSFSFGEDDSQVEEVSQDAVSEQSAIEEYRADLCEELGNMVASIDGVGTTKVMITIDRTTQTVYATEDTTKTTDTQTDSATSYVIISEEDGGESGLTITTILPKVKGVLIICEGGGDDEVKETVTEAVSAALGISSSKICVTKLSS